MKWYYWVKIFENSYCTHYIHRLKMWATALLADFWPAVRLCIMSVLEVSTEQQRSKWWLSWKVRLELSLFPMANPCSTWTIVKCKFVLGAWNILDAPLTLCPPPPLSWGLHPLMDPLGPLRLHSSAVRWRSRRPSENKAGPSEIDLIELNYSMRWHIPTWSDLF